MAREGKYVSMNLSDEDHKRAKVVAAKTGKTLKQIFLDAIAALEIKLAQEEKK